jgi:lipopolysaccharide/colanic/teichoic acid biosynthesis glycosyltransferase
MATRVLLLTQWFDPEPTFKGIVFARELVRQGFEVEVVTGFPNYPGGKVYPGYRIKWLQREVIDGVQVTRLPLYPDHGQSAVKRVLNYTSFAASALVYGLLFAKRPAVIYAYHPPLTVGVAAGLVRFFRRIPVVYDIQDMWPDTLRATGMLNNERALGIVALVCRWVYRRVDQIAVLSPGFKKLLEQRGVPEEKIEVIYNWADEASLTTPQGKLPANFPPPDKFRIVFAGNMGKAQALDAVLNAAVLLQHRGSAVCFVLLGGGVEATRLEERAAELSLGNVVFLPPVPMTEVGTSLKAADALLVHLRKDPLFEITIPSKTQAYMAVGKPLLMAVDGDAADLIREARGGVIASSEDPQGLAAAAESLASMRPEALASMGARAQRHYNEHLSLQVGVERFGALFKRVGTPKVFDLKRVFDFSVAAAALVLLTPPLGFLTWRVRRKFGKPAFFRQMRPGLGGRPFEMVKFRTMADARDANGRLLPDAERLTPFGRFLRSSSLDELPELWNVLKGDMSLVGPRPLLMEYLPLYSKEQARRHEVRPGITGWAQVNGRNALSWDEKFKFDVWYVDNRTMWLDIKILWLTVRKVLVRDGISAEGDATMPRFTGPSPAPHGRGDS